MNDAPVGKLPEPSAPLTEEQIAAAWVGGPPPPLTAPIEIAEYDETWPALYSREESRLRTALGDRALAVEHVGSTSVPGLPAKPIVDIDLIVVDSASEADYVPQLEAAGYVLRIREPDWYEHRCFKGPDTNVNLHVFSPGCDEHVRHVLFRDWLRTHTEDRERYAAAKRELASQDWKYVQNYADAKSEIVVDILRKAGCV